MFGLVHSGEHRADGRASDRCNFFERDVVLSKCDHFALVIGKQLNRRVQGLRPLCKFCRGACIWGLISASLDLVLQNRALAPLDDPKPFVMADAEQPALEVTFLAVPGQRAKGPGESLLHGVLAILGVS